jgi:hypothetical protein
MPEFCTCGTQLVPDSLFCHKCGRPTREILEPEPPEPVAVLVAPPPVRPEPPPLNLQNAVALRIALLVAISATLLFFLPYLNWLGAGFFAVFFYRRRTGHLFTMESGIWMGWITGLLMFAIMACLLTASWAVFRAVGGVAAFQADFKATVDPKVLETLKLLQNGPDVAKMLLQLFVFTTLLSMTGGALGAKMVGRH